MPRRAVRTAAVLAVAGIGLAGCGGGSGSTDHPSVTPPTGNAFSATFTGPDVAAPGQTVTATLTNTGRLPDKYQFQPDPQNSATVSPFTIALAPGQSTTIRIKVAVVPLILHLQDASGGLGTAADLSIGAQG